MSVIIDLKKTLYVTKEVVKLIWGTSKGYAIYTIFLLTFNSLIPIGEAYFIKKIIDSLTLSFEGSAKFNTILFYLAGFIVVTLFSRLIENQRNSTQIILGNLFGKNIQYKIVDKTTKLDFWRFEDPKFHDKLDRVSDQATWKPLNTFYNLFDSLQSLFILISIFIVLYALNWIVMVLMVVFAVPSLLVQIKYGNVWWNLLFGETPDSRKLFYYHDLMTKSNAVKDVKILSLKNYIISKYKQLYERLFDEQKKVIIKRHIWELFTYILSDIVLVFFFIFLVWSAYLKKIGIGDFTFYSTLYLRGVTSLHSIVRDVAGIYENNLFIYELLEYLNLEEEARGSSKNVPKIKEGFEFKNVWFKYPKTDQWILKGVSLRINVKNNVALVGENGAGKTTIVKLLTRLYEPTKGEIFLDGINIQKFDLKQYRRLFGVAFQDFAKFHFSVAENIKLGDIHTKISKYSITQMAKKVRIHNKITSLPNKYDTILGRWFHEGYELSHGEWQKIAIARALIRHAPFYILDEPTAALDAKAEYLVFKQFKSLVKKKTALFISHRFSNVKLADMIIVLKNGKIIQQGSHEELMQQKGLYKELYDFQAKRYLE